METKQSKLYSFFIGVVSLVILILGITVCPRTDAYALTKDDFNSIVKEYCKGEHILYVDEKGHGEVKLDLVIPGVERVSGSGKLTMDYGGTSVKQYYVKIEGFTDDYFTFDPNTMILSIDYTENMYKLYGKNFGFTVKVGTDIGTSYQNSSVVTVKSELSRVERVTERTIVWDSGKASLNFKSATVYTGEKVTLSCNNLPEGATVVYKSSDATVAKVNKSGGQVEAIKAGNVKITAEVKVPASCEKKACKYKLTCKISVKKAENVKIVKNTKDLKAALTNGKGGMIKLGADIACDSIIIKKGTYRLDLNGYGITCTSKDGLAAVNLDGGNLTITDSKGKGSITCANTSGALRSDKGKLVIFGGVFNGIAPALILDGTSTVDIYGGKFYGLSYSVVNISGKLTINGGSFGQVDNDLGIDDFITLEINSNADGPRAVTTINGGKFTSGFYNINICTDEVLTINGGDFTAQSSCINQDDGTLTVNNGNFKSDKSSFYFSASQSDNCKATFNGCRVVSYEHVFNIQNAANVTINNGSYMATGKEYKSTDKSAADKLNYEVVYINDNSKGKVDIAKGLLLTSEIHDKSVAGQHLVASEFKRNKSIYKSGMEIYSPDDLYSVYMNAVENLEKEISFITSRELYDVLCYYDESWIESNTQAKIAYNKCNCSFDYIDKKTYDNTKLKIKISMDYYFGYEVERLAFDSSLTSKASKIAVDIDKKYNEIIGKTIKKGMTDKEKVLAINDYIIQNCSYDYSFADTSHTMEGVLFKKKAVCEGYATTFSAFCDRLGIECCCITGYGGDPAKGYEPHMWNMVVIGGKELYIDVTFADSANTAKWTLKEYDEFYKDGFHYLPGMKH